ncbi:hypothetical protein COLO4_02214 [Corchorus olitorius]|uniref:Uncharacterized protein n=1 Tax=Corchorus olitorius TaxID=93759 RepID=A0A1R3L1G5_9ROSI|nr:hypothetical protein COLO4_02214 [Corchorus olitorius]
MQKALEAIAATQPLEDLEIDHRIGRQPEHGLAALIPDQGTTGRQILPHAQPGGVHGQARPDLQAVQGFFGAAPLAALVHHQQCPLDGLGQELHALLEHIVVGAQAHHLHGVHLTKDARDEDEGRFRCQRPRHAQRLGAGEARQDDVGKDDVVGLLAQGQGETGTLVDDLGLQLEAVPFQLDQDQLGVELAVLYQEDLDLFREGHKRTSALDLFAQGSRVAHICRSRMTGYGCTYLHSLTANAPGDTARSWRRLVEYGPEHAEVTDRGNEITEFDRLDHVGVHAQFVGLFQIGLLPRRRQHDHGDAAQLRGTTHQVQHLEAIDLGQLEIQQHHGGIARLAIGIGLAAQQVINRFGAVTQDHDIVGQLAALQSHQGKLQIVRIVFDQHNGFEHE